MYKDFAYIYDKLSFDIDYEKYAENIKTLIKNYKIKNERILELAAGSGMLTRHFFNDFKNIDALDLSVDMLNVFASKYDRENVNLIYYDMIDFSNENTYDVIVILLDSINYVTDPNDLKKLFENSYKNLKEGGLIIFDINSEKKIKEVFGSNSYVYEYEDIFYTWVNDYYDEIVDMHLDFFVENEDGTYKRIKEFQQERLYTRDFIKRLIKEVGFKDIREYDEDSFGKVTDNTMRILYAGVKEGSY